MNWKNTKIGVADQKKCASCYAFAATTALEILFNLNSRQALSQQDIIDCDPDQSGCDGGNPF